MQARGLGLGECPDEWNISHPEQVAAVAKSYVEAGSEVILTNTFGASRIRLGESGLGEEVEAINQMGVRISLEAAAGRACVFASMGPTGKMLAAGGITLEEIRRTFIEQAEILAEAGADGLVVETMSDLNEARAAVEAAHATGLPVVGCMVFDSGKNKDRTMMGTTPEQAAEGLREAGADLVGANCGHGISGFVLICERLRAAGGGLVWIKTNAGLPVIENDQVVYKSSAEEFARCAPALVQAGAGFLGGCCGTNPEFVQVLGKVLRGEQGVK